MYSKTPQQPGVLHFCLFPHLAPAHTICSSSWVIFSSVWYRNLLFLKWSHICKFQVVFKTIVWTDFIPEKESSVFVGMSSSHRLKGLPLVSLTLPRTFERGLYFSFSYNSAKYTMILKRDCSQNLFVEEMLVCQRQPKHCYFPVLFGKEIPHSEEFGRQAISCRKAMFKMLTASFLSAFHFPTSLNEGLKLDYLYSSSLNT